MACDMSEPCKFPSLDSCQKMFLRAHKDVYLALHPFTGLVLQAGFFVVVVVFFYIGTTGKRTAIDFELTCVKAVQVIHYIIMFSWRLVSNI